MSKPDKYCPLWLYKVLISVTVYDYIVRDIAIFVSTKNLKVFLVNIIKNLRLKKLKTSNSNNTILER